MPDNVTYLHLPPYLGAMQRLMEDDVTTENVEQHIADYLAKLSTWFTPEQLKSSEPGRAQQFPLSLFRAFFNYDYKIGSSRVLVELGETD